MASSKKYDHFRLLVGKDRQQASAVWQPKAFRQGSLHVGLILIVGALMLTYLGQTFGKHTSLDLAETCRLSLPRLQAAAPKELILNACLPVHGPIIRANAKQIQQILTNLATNAWEAIGEKKGTVNLSAKTVAQPDIQAAHRFPVDWQPRDLVYACLEVCDTGCGIVEEAYRMYSRIIGIYENIGPYDTNKKLELK